MYVCLSDFYHISLLLFPFVLFTFLFLTIVIFYLLFPIRHFLSSFTSASALHLFHHHTHSVAVLAYSSPFFVSFNLILFVSPPNPPFLPPTHPLSTCLLPFFSSSSSFFFSCFSTPPQTHFLRFTASQYSRSSLPPPRILIQYFSLIFTSSPLFFCHSSSLPAPYPLVISTLPSFSLSSSPLSFPSFPYSFYFA